MFLLHLDLSLSNIKQRIVRLLGAESEWLVEFEDRVELTRGLPGLGRGFGEQHLRRHIFGNVAGSSATCTTERSSTSLRSP